VSVVEAPRTEVDAAEPRLVAALALMEAQLESERREKDIPGLAAVVVHDQDVIWARGIGLADLKEQRPMEADTPIRVGSITKVFTAAMLMQLRDAGKLQLDDPVDTHIPGFSIRSPFPGSKAITLRQLVSHTAGLPVEAPLDHFRTMAFPSGQEMAESLKDSELGFMPATQFRYSNAGFAVLGRALERAAGQPYSEYVVQRILKPLGMADSGFDADSAATERMATLYRAGRKDSRSQAEKRRQVEMFHPEIGGLVPSGHLYSSVLDMARFISLQFSEGTAAENGVLAANSVKEMHAPVWIAPDWSGGIGLGWHLRPLGKHTMVFKSGLTFGSTTDAAFIPALKLGVAVFVNSVALAPVMTRAGLELLAPIVETLSKAPTVDEPTMGPEESEIYLGTYAWPAMQLAVEVKIVDGRLAVVADTGLSIDTAMLTPAGEHSFRMRGGSVSGDIATFELGQSGRIRLLHLGPYTFEREETAQ
jgi:CubicO group peptidase (beta-lactamase class C family)